MEEEKNLILDGFFYFFGFTENPAEKEVKSILKGSAGERIKGDLKKINEDYRKSYNKLRKEALCIE